MTSTKHFMSALQWRSWKLWSYWRQFFLPTFQFTFFWALFKSLKIFLISTRRQFWKKATVALTRPTVRSTRVSRLQIIAMRSVAWSVSAAWKTKKWRLTIAYKTTHLMPRLVSSGRKCWSGKRKHKKLVGRSFNVLRALSEAENWARVVN